MWFVSKAKHRAAIEQLEAQMDLMRIGHLQQVRALEAHLKDLSKLVFPEIPKNVDPVVSEVNSVLNGSDKPAQISDEEHNKFLEGAREADLLFSGDYDTGLLQ